MYCHCKSSQFCQLLSSCRRQHNINYMAVTNLETGGILAPLTAIFSKLHSLYFLRYLPQRIIFQIKVFILELVGFHAYKTCSVNYNLRIGPSVFFWDYLQALFLLLMVYSAIITMTAYFSASFLFIFSNFLDYHVGHCSPLYFILAVFPLSYI